LDERPPVSAAMYTPLKYAPGVRSPGGNHLDPLNLEITILIELIKVGIEAVNSINVNNFIFLALAYVDGQ